MACKSIPWNYIIPVIQNIHLCPFREKSVTTEGSILLTHSFHLRLQMVAMEGLRGLQRNVNKRQILSM